MKYGVNVHDNRWRLSDGYRACQYCGSMHPDDLFAAIEAGAMVTGTDKNYKIYVAPAHPDPTGVKVVSGCNAIDARWGKMENWVAVTDENRAQFGSWGDYNYVMIGTNGPVAHCKFYFEHLDDAAQQRFIDLYNAKKINLEPHFGLYVLPFFMRLMPKGSNPQ